MRLLDSLQRASLRGALAIPPGVRARLIGPPPRNDRGTALDAGLHLMLWLERRIPKPITGGTPDVARASMLASIPLVECAPADVPTADTTVAGVPVRVYGAAQAPVLVYLHGGGWVCGDLRTHDRLCRRLCAEAGLRVISVDYRRAPEFPFPVPLEDSLAVTRTVLRECPGPVGIGGDSAGGNLSAVICQLLRDAGEPMPALQVLIYPAVDHRRLAASHATFAAGYLLGAADIDWYHAHYAAPDPLDPRVSPLLAARHEGLPPAIVVTAGFDPLRDEGEAYVATLRGAGVPVTHLDAADLVHGFVLMDGAIAGADREVRRLIAALRAYLPCSE